VLAVCCVCVWHSFEVTSFGALVDEVFCHPRHQARFGLCHCFFCCPSRTLRCWASLAALTRCVGVRRLLYLRSMGKNFRKDVSDIRATFPELASDFALPEALLPEVCWWQMRSRRPRHTSLDSQWLGRHRCLGNSTLAQRSASARQVRGWRSTTRRVFFRL
jgi:hypothetical protein